MADLTAKKRDNLKKSVFGLPEKRAYPMPDKQHAANAKTRAKQMLHSGHLSKEDYDRVVKKADEILGEKDGGQ